MVGADQEFYSSSASPDLGMHKDEKNLVRLALYLLDNLMSKFW